MKNFYNKVFSTWLLTCLMALTPSAAMAQEYNLTGVYEVNGLWYKLLNDDQCKVVSSDGKNTIVGDIVIPEFIEVHDKRYSVIRIDNNAFGGCSSLKSIVIPNTVTIIDKYAFRKCISLESISIPESVTGIGDNAFYGCI